MSSPRKTAANRANAQRSTGPRTDAGRSRARLNALKHGLAIPASADPALQLDIDRLARLLAGAALRDPVVMLRALRVAEAAVDVQRARRARHELLRRWDLSSGLPRQIQPPEPPPDPRPVRERLADLADERSGEDIIRAQEWLDRSLERLAQAVKPLSPPDTSRQEAADSAAWNELIHQLERLERYERRARSRRERAIKELDYIKTKAASA